MSVPAHDEFLDARGLLCPEPLMLTRNRLRTMAPGAILRVDATDPTTTRDLEQLCRFLGHVMQSQDSTGDVLSFWIRKAQASP